MKMKSYLAAAAAASMLMAGCADSSAAVTEENAPTDVIRTLAGISSESSGEDVLNALDMLIGATAEAYDYKMEMRNTTETSSPYFSGDGLDTMTTVMDQRDIRYADQKGVYELLEQDSGQQQIMGLMDANASGTDTVYASYSEGGFDTPNSTGVVETMESAPNSIELTDEEVEESARSMVTYPLYSLVGANLILQPFTAPEYYTFTLNQSGSDYQFDISIKDHDAYNAYLDDYVVTNYGYDRVDLDGSGTYVADVYDTTNVDIQLTVDENGVIKKILNNNFNEITTGEESINAYTKQTCLIGEAPEKSGEFFSSFFGKVADGSIKEGDSFQVDLSQAIVTADDQKELNEADSSDNADTSDQAADSKTEDGE